MTSAAAGFASMVVLRRSSSSTLTRPMTWRPGGRLTARTGVGPTDAPSIVARAGKSDVIVNVAEAFPSSALGEGATASDDGDCAVSLLRGTRLPVDAGATG